MQATLKASMTPEKYLEKINQLRNPQEIQAVCEELTRALFNETDKPKTRTNKLTPYNKVINTIPDSELVEGENAYIQTKADGSLWKRHLHFKFTGLADTKWYGEGGINTKTIVLDRLENRRKVEVAKYLETTIKLLQSEDPHELAVGLIAASGRRPVEILVRGSFTFTFAVKLPLYLKPGYFVNFRGQAKKRDYGIPEDERTEYRIGVLVPASIFVAAFKRFRQMPEAKELLDLVRAETKKGTDPEIINDMIDSRRGNSLRRIVSREFSSFLPARFGDTELNNKSLRAVYTRLVTDRDCPKNIADLLWASRAVGHFVDESKPDDSQLNHLVTTLGYFDYYADSVVPFVEAQQKLTHEKSAQVRAFSADIEIVKNLQEKWDLPNQQTVIHYLIEKANQIEKLERQLMESQSRIAQLEQERSQSRAQSETQQPQAEVSPDDNLEAKIEAMVAKALQKHLPQQVMPVTQSQEAVTTTPPAVKTKPEQPEKDWESVPSEELRSSKARGASEERIYRAFKAACDYNDVQPSNDTRWFIGNVTLRDLSGCNGMLVKDWMERYQTSVSDHNNKYGLGQYHNKRHKNVNVSDVIKW